MTDSSLLILFGSESGNSEYLAIEAEKQGQPELTQEQIEAIHSKKAELVKLVAQNKSGMMEGPQPIKEKLLEMIEKFQQARKEKFQQAVKERASKTWGDYAAGHQKNIKSMQDMLYEAVQNTDDDGQRLSQAEVQAALDKASKSGGKITLNEISSMFIGIERACIEGKITKEERDGAIAQLETHLEDLAKTTYGPHRRSKFNRKAMAYITDVLANRSTTDANAELIQLMADSISSDGRVSTSERKALVLQILRGGERFSETLETTLQAAFDKAGLSPRQCTNTIERIKNECEELNKAKNIPLLSIEKNPFTPLNPKEIQALINQLSLKRPEYPVNQPERVDTIIEEISEP